MIINIIHCILFLPTRSAWLFFIISSWLDNEGGSLVVIVAEVLGVAGLAQRPYTLFRENVLGGTTRLGRSSFLGKDINPWSFDLVLLVHLGFVIVIILGIEDMLPFCMLFLLIFLVFICKTDTVFDGQDEPLVVLLVVAKDRFKTGLLDCHSAILTLLELVGKA